MASVLLLPDPTALALVSIEVNEEAKMIIATARTTSREAICLRPFAIICVSSAGRPTTVTPTIFST